MLSGIIYGTVDLIQKFREMPPGGNAISICLIRMDMSNPLRSHCNGITQGGSLRDGQRGAFYGGVMAYYKVRIEVWCDWDPKESSVEEIVENISTGEAICTSVKVIAVVDRPQDIDDDEAMSFFGGEEGDADQSQG